VGLFFCYIWEKFENEIKPKSAELHFTYPLHHYGFYN